MNLNQITKFTYDELNYAFKAIKAELRKRHIAAYKHDYKDYKGIMLGDKVSMPKWKQKGLVIKVNNTHERSMTVRLDDNHQATFLERDLEVLDD